MNCNTNDIIIFTTCNIVCWARMISYLCVCVFILTVILGARKCCRHQRVCKASRGWVWHFLKDRREWTRCSSSLQVLEIQTERESWQVSWCGRWCPASYFCFLFSCAASSSGIMLRYSEMCVSVFFKEENMPLLALVCWLWPARLI